MRFTSRLVATSRAASSGQIALPNISLSLSLFTCMRVGAPASVHTNADICERAYVCVNACVRACVSLHQCLFVQECARVSDISYNPDSESSPWETRMALRGKPTATQSRYSVVGTDVSPDLGATGFSLLRFVCRHHQLKASRLASFRMPAPPAEGISACFVSYAGTAS